MRSKLQFEGWETADLLPTGWMYKRTWEGLISNGSFSTNTVYITREGNVFESVKLAVEFMESLEEEYTEKDREQFKALVKTSKFYLVLVVMRISFAFYQVAAFQ